jgi:pantothenate kinase-related protein Tda10
LTSIVEAIGKIRAAQDKEAKPLAIVLAGHNGSGKSTMWKNTLADELRMPLINADRMMLSVLPEFDPRMAPRNGLVNFEISTKGG